MNSLILLGCGGNAYDVLDIVEAINALRPTWRVVGLLDDSRAAGSDFAGHPVLGSLAEAARFENSLFLNTIGSDQSFRRRADCIRATGLPRSRFATLVHPGAGVSSRATLGHGVYVNFGVSIAGATVLGDHVSCGANATIGHDTTIGNYSVVAPSATISGFVSIEPSCYIGAAAAIKQRLHVGAEALIGLAAVVTRNVPAGAVVVGNPARPISVPAS